MIGKVFTKQICCGVASALGFSGSVYFVVKQTVPADPITTIAIAPPTAKSDNVIDLTDPISKAADIGVGDIDVMFQILNRMQEHGIVPTIQQLIEHKDKWEILAELLQDCFPKQDGANGDVKASSNPECKVPETEEKKKEFLEMFLKMGEKIKELIEENKKEMKDGTMANVKKLTSLKALKQLMNAKSLSESPQKDSQANAFLTEFKTFLTTKAQKDGTTVDTKLMTDLNELIDVHTKSASSLGDDGSNLSGKGTNP